MHRTTILLPHDLHRSAEIEARAHGISLSELNRRKLAHGSEEPENQTPAFFSRRPWVDFGPDDLAARHDDYLYDG